MMVLTAKLKKKNVLAFILVIAAAAAILLLTGRSKTDGAEADLRRAETNDDRVAFLQSFGWEVDPNPEQAQEVRIPSESNEVFERYNELQRSQDFDLTPYSGQCVKQYRYRITNYPDAEASVYATLLVRDGKVIGGDVSSSAQGGRVHGFAMPGNLAKQ